MSNSKDKKIIKRYTGIKKHLRYGTVILKYAPKSVKIKKKMVVKSDKYARIYKKKGHKSIIKCHLPADVQCSPGQVVKYVLSRKFSRTKSAIIIGVVSNGD